MSENLPIRCDGCTALHGEVARTADELAFWKHQAVWHRAYMLAGKEPDEVDETQALRELEDCRAQENRERYGQRGN